MAEGPFLNEFDTVKRHFLRILFQSGGCQARLKAQGSDPCLRDTLSRRGNLVGVREFKSRPPHQIQFLCFTRMTMITPIAAMAIPPITTSKGRLVWSSIRTMLRY
jgi:hypothetical protein